MLRFYRQIELNGCSRKTGIQVYTVLSIVTELAAADMGMSRAYQSA
jgi:hypothetical protein